LFYGLPEKQQATRMASGAEPMQKLNSESVHAQQVALEFRTRSPPLAVYRGQSDMTPTN
jgi:hypothetical protein